jgi:uncharacterized membrane protein YgdD (TMEM256/DUF423 family)
MLGAGGTTGSRAASPLLIGEPMSPQARLFIALGALSALITVVLGAATTHRPDDASTIVLPWLQTAMQYQQFHALALVAVGLVMDRKPSRWLSAAGWFMVAGTLLFCGNLYLRSLAGVHALHAVTPFGGAAFMLGWLALLVGTLRR